MLNANKLKAKIIESGLNIAKVAELLGINTATLYRKISNGHFLVQEIKKLRTILKLTLEEIDEIFL